jgi:hypothetical protein
VFADLDLVMCQDDVVLLHLSTQSAIPARLRAIGVKPVCSVLAMTDAVPA